MADFVLSIAHSDLMTLMDHLPAVHPPWWQTFIQVGTPIITAATSIITVSVLISNRKLTEQVADSNKELSKMNLNLSLYDRILKFYTEYAELYNELIEQSEDLYGLSDDDDDYVENMNIIDTDNRRRIRMVVKIKSLLNSSELMLSAETVEIASRHIDNFNTYIKHIKLDNFINSYETNDNPVFHSRWTQIDDAENLLSESHYLLMQSIKKNELAKFSSFNKTID